MVFHDGSRVADLPGFTGLGHLRYPTPRNSTYAEAQPFYVNSPHGICFAHNGNLNNAEELKSFLGYEAHGHVNTDSDSGPMLNVFAAELNETKMARVNEDLFASPERMYGRCVGGWTCTAMLVGFGLIGFRDPYGTRPLVLGSRPSLHGEDTDYMIASEPVAMNQLGFGNSVDTKPVFIKEGPPPAFRQVHKPASNMGYKLADTVLATLGEEEVKNIDVVIPIPETSNTSALWLNDTTSPTVRELSRTGISSEPSLCPDRN
ncbi:MAG: amidophosphoribosyltransferase [Geoglossum umbratile]|nr:MAG: amidophosphoribosyltransferase [Geoglossum umbratile]